MSYRHLTSGRRTGVVANTALIVKDADGYDNIDSFWENTSKVDESPEQAVSPPVSPDNVTSEIIPHSAGGISTSDYFPETSAISPGEAQPDSPIHSLTFSPGDEDSVHIYEEDDKDDDDESLSSSVKSRKKSTSPVKRKPGSKLNETSDSEEEDTEEEDSPTKKNTLLNSQQKKPKQKKPSRPMSERSDDDDDADESIVVTDGEVESARKKKKVNVVSDDRGGENGNRRSGRTKFPPLQYWKNERYIFERNNVGIGAALPTVAGISDKTKTPVAVKRKGGGGPKGERRLEAPMDMSDIIKERGISKSTKAKVWNDDRVKKTRIFCQEETMKLNEHELPMSAKRSKDENELVGVASQAFFTPQMSNGVPGWISGQVVLPPTAIKDAEGVGACTQLFFVSETQGKCVEVAIALAKNDKVNFDADTAQRYLVGTGDQFFVPPHNVYRLENHSSKLSAKISWVIIKPIEARASESEGELE